MITLRVTNRLAAEIRNDLRRPHAFAYERVGFLYAKQTTAPSGPLLLACEYQPLNDDQYLLDETVGARFDNTAIRGAMQHILSHPLSVFHVHLHEHDGIPRPSRTDTHHMAQLLPSFVHIRPDQLHGALILSNDSASAQVWSNDHPKGTPVTKISVVGAPLRFFLP